VNNGRNSKIFETEKANCYNNLRMNYSYLESKYLKKNNYGSLIFDDKISNENKENNLYNTIQNTSHNNGNKKKINVRKGISEIPISKSKYKNIYELSKEYKIIKNNDKIDKSKYESPPKVLKPRYSFNYGKKDTQKQFLDAFINLSNQFEISIIYTTKTESFLSGEYLEKYRNYFLGNYEDLLDKDFLKIYKSSLGNIIIYGIKPIITKIYEEIRYFSLIFLKPDINQHLLFLQYGPNLFQMNLLLEDVIRNWFEGVLDLMINSFYDYMEQGRTDYIIFSIILFIFLILYYFIVWRICEEKLNSLIKKSGDLINLIPYEIKNILIEKLNQ
jgi:hypothetical protein